MFSFGSVRLFGSGWSHVCEQHHCVYDASFDLKGHVATVWDWIVDVQTMRFEVIVKGVVWMSLIRDFHRARAGSGIRHILYFHFFSLSLSPCPPLKRKNTTGFSYPVVSSWPGMSPATCNCYLISHELACRQKLFCAHKNAASNAGGCGQLTMAKPGLQASTASRMGRVPGGGNFFPAFRSSFTSSRTNSHNWW